MLVPEVEMTAARKAYEAYCDYTGGKSLVTGDKLPMWSELKSEIRNAWHAAAKAANKTYKGE